jgi:antitoxin PrlF
MEIAAKMSSKGQITVPKAVRDALRAVLVRTPDLLSLPGTIKVPASRRNAAWDDVVRKTRSARADARR